MAIVSNLKVFVDIATGEKTPLVVGKAGQFGITSYVFNILQNEKTLQLSSNINDYKFVCLAVDGTKHELTGSQLFQHLAPINGQFSVDFHDENWMYSGSTSGWQHVAYIQTKDYRGLTIKINLNLNILHDFENPDEITLPEEAEYDMLVDRLQGLYDGFLLYLQSNMQRAVGNTVYWEDIAGVNPLVNEALNTLYQGLQASITAGDDASKAYTDDEIATLKTELESEIATLKAMLDPTPIESHTAIGVGPWSSTNLYFKRQRLVGTNNYIITVDGNVHCSNGQAEGDHPNLLNTPIPPQFRHNVGGKDMHVSSVVFLTILGTMANNMMGIRMNSDGQLGVELEVATTQQFEGRFTTAYIN